MTSPPIWLREYYSRREKIPWESEVLKDGWKLLCYLHACQLHSWIQSICGASRGTAQEKASQNIIKHYGIVIISNA